MLHDTFVILVKPTEDGTPRWHVRRTVKIGSARPITKDVGYILVWKFAIMTLGERAEIGGRHF